MNLDHIGKYRVVGTIGKGAMGEVYKAKDPLLNRFVAIKRIAPALAADPDFRRRFQREAQSAAQLSHANIVTVFDFGEEDGLPYMAMELLEGHDLKEVMRSRDLRLADKLSVMEQLGDGLAFAHSKGVVHRDLKPGNIHLQPGGQVKILDFGLALLGTSDMTKTGTVMGTPHYMSPEQVRGQRADARSDVFSLGAVFYELLSRHRAFDADSVHGVLFQILEQQPDPIRKWAPEVPTPLVSVVERALVKDPAGRFADAGEMARALAEAREAIAGETAVSGGEDVSTVFQATDATVVTPSTPPPPAVRGANALKLARPPAHGAHLPKTVTPDPTIGPGPATQAPLVSGLTRAILFGGVAVGLVAAGAVGGMLILRGRGPARGPATPAGLETAQLADVYVTNQVELARSDLAVRDYDGAARRAEEVLKLAPDDAGARKVLDDAREAKRQIEETAAEARAAFERDDVAAASLALGRVMALDPQHPVIGELSAALRQHLRPQAEDARRGADGARRSAEDARAGALPGFARGQKLVAEAGALFQKQDFAAAAQRYMEGRDAFERAKREADEARVAAARPAPSAVPTATTPPPAPARVSAAPAPAPTVAPQLTVSPTAAIAAQPIPTSVRVPPSTPTPAPLRSSEAEVRRVIEEYARAMQSRDIALYRALKPDLSADDERRLREAFKNSRTDSVGITVESVEIDGDRATVRATRQDVIDGRTTKAVVQTFRLARVGSIWQIR
jgi:tetratricopeptide (TPR) repeat protein